MSNFNDVGEFHRKFDLHYVSAPGDGELAGPQDVSADLINFRKNFLYEELQEFVDGVNANDHAAMADALIDLVYVAMGTAHILGYPWEQLWDDVQRANMSKQRAKKDGSDSARGSKYDVVKPAGWRPPETAAILRAHGFTPSAH